MEISLQQVDANMDESNANPNEIANAEAIHSTAEKCKSHGKHHHHNGHDSQRDAFGECGRGIEKSISFDSMATKLGIGSHHRRDGDHNRKENEHRRKTRAA